MANTTNRSYPLPVDTKTVRQEIENLQQNVLPMIDTDVQDLVDQVAGLAPIDHTHTIGEITDLTTTLAGKMPADTTFALSDLTDVVGSAEAPDGYVLVKVGSDYVAQAALAALGPHGHLITDISGLPTALTSKAAASSVVTHDAVQGLTETGRAIARANIGLDKLGLFLKADKSSSAFTKTAAGTASIKAGTLIEADGRIISFAAAATITMPALVAGADYAIWIKPDGSLEATIDFSVGPLPNSRKLGGFHYAPGGNAAAMAGGNTTPQINEYSFWDIKFRPACADPRGMALVAGSFWVDIYLLGVNHHTDGSSRYNVTIADGSSPPKVPTAFGGNGATTYGTLTWWEAAEVMQSHGKKLLSYAEFAAAAYGTTEASSGGTDPVSTILRAAYTSKWGVMLATGNLWVWGKEFGGSYGAASYVSQGRGSAYLLSNAAVFGGAWGFAASSGSRASYWNYLPSSSDGSVGARGCCDHLTHV